MSGGIQQVLERELKLRLTAAEWAQLRQSLGTPTAVHHQVNTYFDTEDHELRHYRGVMVRIRQEDGRFELTTKDRILGEQSGQLETRERTESMEATAAAGVTSGSIGLTALDSALAAELNRLVASPLRPIGHITNQREVFVLSGGYLAELDRTEFPNGRVDYEVEIELRAPGHTYQGARAALQAKTVLDCSRLPASRSKYGRFLAALELLQERGP